ncbi:MAG: ABC transporter substrate-binding protein [bacterium]|nr:ABC transporter substrate-binding protein [bacterium]
MLRGFRWQVLAMFAALALFAAALIVRTSEPAPLPTPTLTLMPTNAADIAVLSPTQTPETASVQPSAVTNVIDPTTDGVVTYREALVGAVQRLNPLYASLNPVDRDITALIFEGLTRTNEFGEARPALAERWVISSDGLEYTFFLRQDVLWQDGTPFSAADVLYTMSVLRSPDFSGDSALGRFWRTVETEQLEPFVVRFRLTQPLATFLDKVSIGILPEHVLRGTNAAALAAHPFNLSPIGTGAYQLEAIRSADGSRIEAVDLRAAPVYADRPEGQAQPFALSRIRFQMYDTFDSALQAVQQGNADGIAGRGRDDRRALFLAANDSGLSSWNGLEPTLGVLIFNWVDDDTRYFRERSVRIGLETGLDRAAMIDRAFNYAAVLANSPIVPGSWAHDPSLSYPPYNPDEARRLLAIAAERFQRQDQAESTETAEVTSEPLPDNLLFGFSILTPDDPALVSLAGEIASQWSQLNLAVTVETVDRTAYQARLEAHDFDIALVEYAMSGSTDPDPFAFWHQGEYPDGENYGGADDRTVSELLERARRDASGINRMEHYRSFQREFVSRAIAIPLYYPVFTYVTTPRLQGIQLGYLGSPADRFRTVGAWTLGG